MIEEGGRDGDDAQHSSPTDGTGGEQTPIILDDVYTGAAYGDLEKLQRLVEREEKAYTIKEPDHLGHYALQWAALNNRTAAAQYLIEVIIFLFFFFFSLILE